MLISEDGISRQNRSSAASFVRVYGKIRRKTADRALLSYLASQTSTKLRNIGRPAPRAPTSAGRWPGARSAQLYAKYLRTYV